MSRKSSLLRLLLMLLLVFVQSCDKSSTTAPPSEFEPTQTLAFTDIPAVSTPQSLTAKESEPPASTATLTMGPSSTPTRTPTPTPILTLEPAEVKKLVLEYMGDNRGCRLPCIWGYTPGASRSEDVRDFILKHGEYHDPSMNISTSYREHSGGAYFRFFEDNLYLGVAFSAYVDNRVHRMTLISYLVYDDGKIYESLFGQPIFNQYMEYYTASRILERYGIPSQILIAAFEDEPDYQPAPWLPFSIVLIYDEQGFLAEYIAPVETVGEKYRGCPWKAHIGISTWSPEEERPLAEVVPGFGRGMNELNIEYFKPLEEATGMTLDEFYQIFKEAGNTQCIETPRSLWSQP